MQKVVIRSFTLIRKTIGNILNGALNFIGDTHYHEYPVRGSSGRVIGHDVFITRGEHVYYTRHSGDNQDVADDTECVDKYRTPK